MISCFRVASPVSAARFPPPKHYDWPQELRSHLFPKSLSRVAIFAATALAAIGAQAQISQNLPFNPASTATLRASAKKVFSHYFTPFIVSIDNKDPSIDYYTAQYLDPNGESGTTRPTVVTCAIVRCPVP